MSIVAQPSADLTLVMEMKLEVLLNVYLAGQLLRVVGLLAQALSFCGSLRVQGEAGRTCRLQQVLSTCCRAQARRERRLCRQVCWKCRVGQGGDGSGGFWKSNSSLTTTVQPFVLGVWRYLPSGCTCPFM